MANLCAFTFMAKGKPEEVREFTKILGQDYSYDQSWNPTSEFGKHFFRVFEAHVGNYEEEDGVAFAEGFGSCAWGLEACVLEGGYYSRHKREAGDKETKGTCLEDIAEEYPSLYIEMISEEPGCEFSERIIVSDGEVSLDVGEFVELYITDEETFEEYKDMLPEDITFEDIVDVSLYLEYPHWFEGDMYDIWPAFGV